MSNPGYTRLISLGRTCQCAYQARRYTGISTAAYFDWLGTPHRGLMVALRRRFEGCFLRENLAISKDGETVVDRLTGFSYRHNFKTLPDSRRIDARALDRDYLEQWEKMSSLAERWHQTVERERILFVRQDSPTRQELLALYDLLAAQAGNRAPSLLLITPPAHKLAIEHPLIRIERACEPSLDPEQWRGDDALWDRILAPHWRPQSSQTRDGDGAADHPRSRSAYRSVNGERSASQPVILFQASTSDGMDGVHRLAAIALELRKLAPEVRSLFLIEGHDGGYLERHLLPCFHLSAHTTLVRSKIWHGWGVEQARELARSAILGVMRAAASSLVVFDSSPHPFVFRAAKAAGLPCALCVPTLARMPLFLSKPGIRALLKAVAMPLLAPYDESPPATACNLPSLNCVGPLTTTQDRSGLPIRRKYGLKRKRNVLVLAELDDNCALIQQCLLAMQHLRQARADLNDMDDIDTVLVYGPRFTRLGELTLPPGVSVSPEDKDLLSCCASTSLVLGGVNYRSIFTLPRTAPRVLLLYKPEDTTHIAFDDYMAAAVACSNLTLVPAGSAGALPSLIAALLEQDAIHRRPASNSGAARAAMLLYGLLPPTLSRS